jgi:hypothetical protein
VEAAEFAFAVDAVERDGNLLAARAGARDDDRAVLRIDGRAGDEVQVFGQLPAGGDARRGAARALAVFEHDINLAALLEVGQQREQPARRRPDEPGALLLEEDLAVAYAPPLEVAALDDHLPARDGGGRIDPHYLQAFTHPFSSPAPRAAASCAAPALVQALAVDLKSEVSNHESCPSQVHFCAYGRCTPSYDYAPQLSKLLRPRVLPPRTRCAIIRPGLKTFARHARRVSQAVSAMRDDQPQLCLCEEKRPSFHPSVRLTPLAPLSL